MRGDRNAVDLRHPLIDAKEVETGAEDRQTDRRRGIDRFQLRQLLPRLLLAVTQSLFLALLLADIAEIDGDPVATRVNAVLEPHAEGRVELLAAHRETLHHRLPARSCERTVGRLWQFLPDVLAQQVAAGSQHRLRALVQVDEASVAVEHDHTVGRALEHRRGVDGEAALASALASIRPGAEHRNSYEMAHSAGALRCERWNHVISRDTESPAPAVPLSRQPLPWLNCWRGRLCTRCRWLDRYRS